MGDQINDRGGQVVASRTNSERRRWLVLAVTITAQFMVILDVAVVNVALPAIEHDLHFSQESLQWVVTAYAILLGGTLMLGGRLADLLRRRRLFVAGVTVFTLSSLLSGLAWSEGSLIVFRGLQGLGGALLAPAALSIVVTTFREGRDRNIALGVWGAASGSGGPAGVLLGRLRRAPRETTRRAPRGKQAPSVDPERWRTSVLRFGRSLSDGRILF